MNKTRRDFLIATSAAAAASALPLKARAQSRPLRIGFVTATPPEPGSNMFTIWRDWLAAQGAQDGSDYVIDSVHANGRIDDVPRVATELAARRPAVVITAYALAVLRAIPQVPVVALGAVPALPQDMAAQGFANRVTGVDFRTGEMDIERLKLLLEVLRDRLPLEPKIEALVHPAARDLPRVAAIRAEAARLNLNYQVQFVSTPEEIAAAMAQAKSAGAQGVQQLANQVTHSQRSHIISHADKLRLPGVYEWPEAVREGGLLSLGNDREQTWHRALHQAWHLARGGAIADVPVVPASDARVAVNRRTAQALGLTLPGSVLQRAHEVVG